MIPYSRSLASKRPGSLWALVILCLGVILTCSSPALANGGGEKKKGGGLLYIQLSPISSYIQRAHGKNAIVTLEVGVDTPNDQAKQKTELLIPRLRSALVEDLQRFVGGKTDSGPINADALSARLQKTTDTVLGPGTGKLLIGTLMVT